MTYTPIVRRAYVRPETVDPFFPVNLPTSYWKAVAEALEAVHNPSIEVVDTYMRIIASLERKGEIDDGA
jgi:hypothetical protein